VRVTRLGADTARVDPRARRRLGRAVCDRRPVGRDAAPRWRVHGAVGVIWVEAYVFAVPAFFPAAVQQLLVPGRDRPVEQRLPLGLRAALSLQAIVMLVWGILLFARPHDAGAVWPWPLAPLAAEAIAAWLLGIGGSAAYISLRADRADMPGAALSYIVLGALWIAAAIFAGDAFHNGLDAALYILFAASVVIVGITGAVLSYREGRYLRLDTSHAQLHS
jgi:hypothetical protein